MAAAPKRAQVSLERSGGFAGIKLRSEVDTNGLDSGDRTRYLELIRGLDLPELSKAAAKSTEGLPDRFQYDLTLQVDERQYQLRYSEKDLPSSLKPLMQLLLERARKSPDRR